MVEKFTSENYESKAIQSPVPVLVDFYADWCGPCKMTAPVVDAIAEEYAGKLAVGKVNVDDCPDIAAKYGVMSIPTLIILKDGEIAAKTVGAMSKDDLKNMVEGVLA